MLSRTLKKRTRQDAAWRQIGAEWYHKDGEELDMVLDALPVSGRVVLRKYKEKA
jgi:hypothetical protein